MLEAGILWFFSIQQDGLTLWYCHKVAWSLDLSLFILCCFLTSTAWSVYEGIKVLTAEKY